MIIYLYVKIFLWMWDFNVCLLRSRTPDDGPEKGPKHVALLNKKQ